MLWLFLLMFEHKALNLWQDSIFVLILYQNWFKVTEKTEILCGLSDFMIFLNFILMLDQIDKMYEIKTDEVRAAQSPGSFSLFTLNDFLQVWTVCINPPN